MQKVFKEDGEQAQLYMEEDGKLTHFAKWDYGVVQAVTRTKVEKTDEMKRVKPRTEGFFICFYNAELKSIGAEGDDL